MRFGSASTCCCIVVVFAVAAFFVLLFLLLLSLSLSLSSLSLLLNASREFNTRMHQMYSADQRPFVFRYGIASVLEGRPSVGPSVCNAFSETIDYGNYDSWNNIPTIHIIVSCLMEEGLRSLH